MDWAELEGERLKWQLRVKEWDFWQEPGAEEDFGMNYFLEERSDV